MESGRVLGLSADDRAWWDFEFRHPVISDFWGTSEGKPEDPAEDWAVPVDADRRNCCPLRPMKFTTH